MLPTYRDEWGAMNDGPYTWVVPTCWNITMNKASNAIYHLLWQKITLLCSHAGPFATCYRHLLHLAHLGYWHVPPAFIIVYTLVAIILDVDD